MSIIVNEKYRIKRNADHETKMKFMINDLKIFENYSQILVLSAIIGYNNKKFLPIKTQASDAVQLLFFKPMDKDIIDLIAYSHEKDQSILKEEKKYNIFESYASGGFDILVDCLEVDFTNTGNNDRLTLLTKLYCLMLTNGFIEHGTDY